MLRRQRGSWAGVLVLKLSLLLAWRRRSSRGNMQNGVKPDCKRGVRRRSLRRTRCCRRHYRKLWRELLPTTHPLCPWQGRGAAFPIPAVWVVSSKGSCIGPCGTPKQQLLERLVQKRAPRRSLARFVLSFRCTTQMPLVRGWVLARHRCLMAVTTPCVEPLKFTSRVYVKSFVGSVPPVPSVAAVLPAMSSLVLHALLWVRSRWLLGRASHAGWRTCHGAVCPVLACSRSLGSCALASCVLGCHSGLRILNRVSLRPKSWFCASCRIARSRRRPSLSWCVIFETGLRSHGVSGLGLARLVLRLLSRFSEAVWLSLSMCSLMPGRRRCFVRHKKATAIWPGACRPCIIA